VNRRRGRAPSPRGKGDSAQDSYFDRSRRPLEILAVVGPLVVLYEIGLVTALKGREGVLTNAAHEGLFRFFWSFGIDASRLSLPALALPAVAVLAILIIWQMLSRRQWTLHLPTVGGMVVEGALFALPLLVIAQVISRVGVPAAAWLQPAEAVAALTPFAQLTMSIGAGIYEELIFRMVLLALLHGALVDLLGMPQRWGVGLAVAVSALLFAIYHPLRDGSGAIVAGRVAFFIVAGVYFGSLYLVRGFGIAVVAHAAYDMAVLAWFDRG